MRQKAFSCFLLTTLSLLSAKDLEIDIKEPRHIGGKLFTDSGGIIKTDNLRIQAKNISLEEVNGEQILYAENDLLIVYEDRFFVGKSLTYNLSTKTGRLENAIGNFDTFFVGGEDLIFHPDKRIEIEQAFATTSDHKDPSWTVHANYVELNDTYEEKAKNITVNVFEKPVFWIPSLSLSQNKEEKRTSKVRYKMFFEKHKQPLIVARYRLLDQNGLKLFLRGEYRINRGGGGALELDYRPSKTFHLSSQNFYAYDTSEKGRSRYQIQGIFESTIPNHAIETYASWDALSDKHLHSDFPLKAFRLDTFEKTECFIRAPHDLVYISLYANPRINSFRGFKQELPSLKLSFKPWQIGQTGCIFENSLKLSYLDYVYAKELAHLVSGFHSGRFSLKQSLCRPSFIGCFSIVPKVDLSSVFYTNSPNSDKVLQTSLSYGLESSAPFKKKFSFVYHRIEPYMHLKGISPLTQKEHYLFSSEDGISPLHQLQLGLKNAVYQGNHEFAFDLSALHFLGEHTFNQVFPKAHLDFTLRSPYLQFHSFFGYNFEKTTFDYSNFMIGWTLNEEVALSLELRHRGEFTPRKNDPSNFLLDFLYSQEELKNSPLSDERTSLLARAQVKLAPLWTLKFQGHMGWRPKAPLYHESQFELSTIISNALKLKLTYTRTNSSNQYTFGIASLSP